MSLIEKLYGQEDVARTKATWDKFPLLQPGLPFLKTSTIRSAIADGDRTYPLSAFKFRLFPCDETDAEFSRRFTLSMNYGIKAINELISLYVNPIAESDLRLQEVPESELFDLVKVAFEKKQQVKGRHSDPRFTSEAYDTMRAIDLGYRVGLVDSSPEVLNSLRYLDQVIKGLEHLFRFSNKRESGLKELPNKWDTNARAVVYSSQDAPMPRRLKYLTLNNSPKYSSILMKLYRGAKFPNELRDYTGVELIVEDDQARSELISYLRKQTSPSGHFEDFTDLSKGNTNTASSAGYGMVKFVLRIPAKMEHKLNIKVTRTLAYESVPVEIQVLTLEDHRKRSGITDASHFEYKKRQFMEVFPILFPRTIYAPLLIE